MDHLPDTRRRGSRHPLAYVLALAACAVLAGARSLTAMASNGSSMIAPLRRASRRIFLRVPNAFSQADAPLFHRHDEVFDRG
ncbi:MULTISPECIES: transposase family protein [unclassified Streptomyces]|uniref:transposase family protein n=1 Tax=unclassified Streptomyces TaxID=2593676 RepID=UPI0022AA2EB4